MSARITRALGALLLITTVATPAFAIDKEHRQMEADLRMLQEQSQQLQNLLGSITDAIKALNAKIDDQTNSNRKALADEKLVIDTLSNDVRVIREKLDDNNVRLARSARRSTRFAAAFSRSRRDRRPAIRRRERRPNPVLSRA